MNIPQHLLDLIGHEVEITNHLRDSHSAGRFDRIELSDWEPTELYAYFTDGHINGIDQSTFGFPVEQLDNITTTIERITP